VTQAGAVQQYFSRSLNFLDVAQIINAEHILCKVKRNRRDDFYSERTTFRLTNHQVRIPEIVPVYIYVLLLLYMHQYNDCFR
jgi:hypothetical protein